MAQASPADPSEDLKVPQKGLMAIKRAQRGVQFLISLTFGLLRKLPDLLVDVARHAGTSADIGMDAWLSGAR